MPQPTGNVTTINLPPPSSTQPSGHLVYVVSSVQSNGNETVSIKDGQGNVVYQASGSSTTGGVFTPLTPTVGPTFETVADPDGYGTYTVTLTTGCSTLCSENTISFNGSDYLQVYTLTTNDAGWKGDFNDLCVQIICFGLQS